MLGVLDIRVSAFDKERFFNILTHFPLRILLYHNLGSAGSIPEPFSLYSFPHSSFSSLLLSNIQLMVFTFREGL
ncbi:hypothetical protein ACTXT7_006865 [Hymenolepis weldensis]